MSAPRGGLEGDREQSAGQGHSHSLSSADRDRILANLHRWTGGHRAAKESTAVELVQSSACKVVGMRGDLTGIARNAMLMPVIVDDGLHRYKIGTGRPHA